MILRSSIFLLFFVCSFSPYLSAQPLDKWLESSFQLPGARFEEPSNSLSAEENRDFFLLGFSNDGWFAYAKGPKGTYWDWGTPCPEGPCYGFNFMNVACEENNCEWKTQMTDLSHADPCYCKFTTNTQILEQYKIRPTKEVEHGAFPAFIEGDELNIKVEYFEKAIYSEVLVIDPVTRKPIGKGPSEPGSFVYLFSKKLGNKKIGIIDHNHSGIVPKSIRPVGWIKAPSGTSMIIVLKCGYDRNGQRIASKWDLLPYVTSIKKGFVKAP